MSKYKFQYDFGKGFVNDFDNRFYEVYFNFTKNSSQGHYRDAPLRLVTEYGTEIVGGRVMLTSKSGKRTKWLDLTPEQVEWLVSPKLLDIDATDH